MAKRDFVLYYYVNARDDVHEVRVIEVGRDDYPAVRSVEYPETMTRVPNWDDVGYLFGVGNGRVTHLSNRWTYRGERPIRVAVKRLRRLLRLSGRSEVTK